MIVFSENLNQLKKHLEFDNKIKFNHLNSMLPFTTRKNERVDFKNNGFLPIVGALARLVSNKDVDSIDINSVIENVLGNEEFEYESKDEYVITSLIKEYLNNNNLNNLIHPKLLLFLPLSNSDEQKGEIKAAQFLNKIFFKNIDFAGVINSETGEVSSNILLEFITDNLNELADGKNDAVYYMPDSLKGIIDIFEEDFNFLLEHKSYLIHHIDLILAYYYFFYLTQFSLKADMNQYSSEIEELYYLLDWESVSKSRIAISNGFNKVRNSLDGLLRNIDIMEHMNILLGKNNLLPFESKLYVEGMDDNSKKEFLKYFKIWINEFRDSQNLKQLSLSNDIEKLMEMYKLSLREYAKKANLDATDSRFGLAIQNLGVVYFLKTRGRYGYMLNMNQELLILITAMCIKEDRIRISNLFEEYEKRGIFFDRESKELIIELFNNLNLIDKKSDSGDVQYVKSIL